MRHWSLVLHSAIILAALFIGLNSALPALFPAQPEVPAHTMEQENLPLLADRYSEEKAPDPRLLAVWGIEAEIVDTAAGDDDGTAGRWRITLEEGRWLLSKKENEEEERKWVFYGVIRRDDGNAAVFYNLAGENPLWRIIPEKGYFDTLFLDTIHHEKISLRDTRDNQWTLGLYHLRENPQEDTGDANE